MMIYVDWTKRKFLHEIWVNWLIFPIKITSKSITSRHFVHINLIWLDYLPLHFHMRTLNMRTWTCFIRLVLVSTSLSPSALFKVHPCTKSVVSSLFSLVTLVDLSESRDGIGFKTFSSTVEFESLGMVLLDFSCFNSEKQFCSSHLLFSIFE